MTTPTHHEIEALLDRGMYLQVDPQVDRLAASADPADVLLAVRAMRYLGCERRGDALALRNARRHPRDGASLVAMLRQQISARGPYRGWRLLHRYPLDETHPAAVRAEYLSLRMRVAAMLRDVESMQDCRDRVLALDATAPWLWVEWAYCLHDHDRLDEALAATERAIELCPGFRAGVQTRATLLLSVGRGDESRALLEREFARSECAGIGYQLFDQQYEHGEHEAAAATLDRIEVLQPRADRWALSRLAARRADVAMARGDLPRARDQAALAGGTGFYAAIVRRIDEGAQRTHRVMLPVGFVRQHWQTCAPATLTALSAYWGREVEHLEVAEAICYDGTPYASERKWAQDNGWLAREFTADWPTTRALIDAGVPFTLSTTFIGSGHLQALIGYDELRGSLLMRDPMQPSHAEYDAASFFDSYRADGPRAMLLLPPDQAARIAGIELPDAAGWDAYFELSAALERHDRDAALAALQVLRRDCPGHRLAMNAERALGLYDGDEAQILAWTERLLERYPDNRNLQLSKASSLWAIGGRGVHLQWLAGLAERADADATTLARYADRLSEDARRLPEALALAHRALRGAPYHATAWNQWAGLTWQSGARQEALPLYRATACLAYTDEDRAAAYARACRFLGDFETGLAFLRRREQTLGDRSGAPAQTLFDELDVQERVPEAFAVLAQAQRRRPGDAALGAFAAQAHLRYGQLDAAVAALQRIEGGAVQQATLLKVRSLVFEARHDFAAALAAAQRASELEPLNLDHRRLAARQLERRQGREAALRSLEAAAAAYPHHLGLQRLLYDWLPDDEARINAQLECMARAHPGDNWTRREQAVQATRQRRYGDALAHARAAVEQADDVAECHAVLGHAVLEQSGYDAAAPHLRAAVQRHVDNDYAVRTLIQRAGDADRARDAAQFVWNELQRQCGNGDGLLTFQTCAEDVLPGAELLERLEGAVRDRPEVWQAWVAQGLQLTNMQRHDEALALYERAAARFPMLPRVHVERAAVLRLMGRRDEAARVLETALAIMPSWNRAVRLYVDVVTEEARDWARAERVLRHALALEPADADLRGLLAWLFERSQRHDEALATAQQALAADPQPQWLWDAARRSAEALGGPERFDALIDAVEKSRPADAWTWVVRAQHGKDDEQALHAAEHAVAMNPRLVDAWLARFARLMRLRRHDEVRQRVGQLPWPDGGPVELRAYAARALRAQGQPADAQRELRSLIDQRPGDYSLWRELADWHDEDDEHAQYVDAAREMVRVAPGAASAHGYLGHALHKSRLFAQAIEPLARALQLDPQYRFAALRLAEAAIEIDQPDTALQALEGIWPNQGSLELAGAGARAACRKRDPRDAALWLRRCFQAAPFDIDNVRQTLDLVRESGLAEIVEPVQAECLREGVCALGAAIDWIEHIAKRDGELSAMRQARPILEAEPRNALKMGMLRWLVGRGKPRPFLEFVRRWREPLRADPQAWGDISWCLIQLGRTRDVVAWLDDWRTREDVPNWVLTNLALAHAQLGQLQASGTVARVALDRDPLDKDALLWASADLAAHGQPQALASLFDRLVQCEPEGWMQPFVGVLRAYLAAARSGCSGDAVDGMRNGLPHFGQWPAMRHLCARLRAQLLASHTAWWLLPWRWLQFTL